MDTFGPTYVPDTLTNVITGLGTFKDPRVSSQFRLCILNREMVEAAYRGDWIARAIIDCPAEDATREWRSWQASAQQIEAIEDLEKSLEIQKKLRLALIRARLYGGAALVLGVRQGQPEEELDLDKIGKDDLQFVVVLNRYELSAGPRIYNVMSRWYTRPEYYTVSTPINGFDMPPVSDPTVPSSPMVRLHPSRVIEFAGNELPDWRLAPMGAGWGDSVLQTVDDTLKDFGMSIGGLAAMISDMKVDVISVPDLTNTLADKVGSANLITRFSLANQAKSTINSLLIDTHEKWERIGTSFAGADGVIRLLMTLVAASGGVPESRLMGSAPHKGLSGAGGSGGEIDIRNYYDTIASRQETQYRPMMEPLDRCLVQSALGKSDKSIHYDWNPLYQPDPAQVAAIALQKAQATQIYWNLGAINENAMRRVVVNQLTEDGTYPGIEDAIDEFGEEPEEPKGDGGFEPGFDPVTGKPLTKGGAGGASAPAPAAGATGSAGPKTVHIHLGGEGA